MAPARTYPVTEGSENPNSRSASQCEGVLKPKQAPHLRHPFHKRRLMDLIGQKFCHTLFFFASDLSISQIFRKVHCIRSIFPEIRSSRSGFGALLFSCSRSFPLLLCPWVLPLLKFYLPDTLWRRFCLWNFRFLWLQLF